MNKFVITICVAFCWAGGHAQDIHDWLNDFRKEAHQELSEFRKQCMEEYLSFLRLPWKDHERKKPTPIPKEDKIPPITLPEQDRKPPVIDVPIVIDGVIRPLPVEPQPIPIEPIKEVPQPEAKTVSFQFFGTPLKVRFDKSKLFHLTTVNENGIADALASIKMEEYDNMLFDCLALREQLQLCDWAYLLMLQSLSEAVAGGHNNDAVLLQAYLYMQSGYKMRLAHDNQHVFMLYTTPHHIYGQTMYIVGAVIYYCLDEATPANLFITEAPYKGEKPLSLIVPQNPKLAEDNGDKRTITSRRYSDVSMSVAVNKNLIDFYNTYPASMLNHDFMTRWEMYANTPMADGVKEQIYPTLKKCIEGMSQKEAVERLLNLVQTGLKYEYDDKVWGQDRAFFAEESLSYPYCDCEDRSILLTRMVRDLLGLRCILVFYPGHLASAVEFTEEDVKGDCILLDDHKYVIADGTFINACLGRTMYGMDNKTAKVIVLK